jgi:predicted nucleic acid-binding protein
VRRARDVLLDTGPLVAVLDARDQWHGPCAAVWPDIIHRCVTTEAVVTEACHFALRGGHAQLPLDFLLRASIPIVGIETSGQRRAAALMVRYASVPMDYADATLVVLGEALDITTVFTTDRRGFASYRPPRRERFELLPVP